MAKSIRRKCPLFGAIKLFDENVLPKNSDVILSFLNVQQEQSVLLEKTKNNISERTICEQVSVEVISLWEKASIPTIKRKSVVDKVAKLHKDYITILKPYKNRKTNAFMSKIAEYRIKAERTLFDIARCKCNILANCSCPKDSKVPIDERPFLIDQRTNRKMKIGNVDKAASLKILNRKERITKYSVDQKQELENLESSSKIVLARSDTAATEIEKKK